MTHLIELNIKLSIDMLAHLLKSGCVGIGMEECQLLVASLYKMMVDSRLSIIYRNVRNLIEASIAYYFNNFTKQCQLLCHHICPFEQENLLGLYHRHILNTPTKGAYSRFQCILAYYVLCREFQNVSYSDFSLDYYSSFTLKNLHSLVKHIVSADNADVDRLIIIISLLDICFGYFDGNSFKECKEIWSSIRANIDQSSKTLKDYNMESKVIKAKDLIITISSKLLIMISSA